MKIGKNDVLPSQMTIFYFCGANILWKTSWGLGDILSTKSKHKEMLTEVIKVVSVRIEFMMGVVKPRGIFGVVEA